jgi:putative transposase
MPSNPALAGAANSASTCGCGCVTRPRRYPSDLTDAQWAVLEPALPVPLCRTPLGGRPERHHRRTMVNAILYLVDNGCKWRALPADFPPWQTVYAMHARWRADGVLDDLTDRLRAAVREAAGRAAEPSAGIMDAQSVAESAEGVVPAATSGFDPHKKVNGRKRHILADTLGLLITVVVSAASVQDRDAAIALVLRARRRGRRLRLAWADSIYEGRWTTWAGQALGLHIEIVRPRDGTPGFHVLPRRWVVERTLAWITRRRRCARDYERLPSTHAAMVHWAAILQMTRRLARTTTPANGLQTASIEAV